MSGPPRAIGWPEPHRLVLVRHGQSRWNAEARFAGWVDVDLTPHGEEQARAAGQAMRDAGLLPDRVFTSMLTRSIRTADLVLDACDRLWAPVTRSWRLNERHYGALQGADKHEFRDVARHPELADLWSRPSEVRPPPMPEGHPFDTAHDPRYAAVARDALPRTESLLDVLRRATPFFGDVIRPALVDSPCVLVVTHANVIRAIARRLQGLDEEAIAGMSVPSGVALCYDLHAPDLPATGPWLVGGSSAGDELL